MSGPAGESEGTRYSFAPLERRGVLLGLRAGPLAVIAGGLVVAVVSLRVLPGALGAVVAIGVCITAVVGAGWPIAGQPAVSWAPVAAAWALRRPHGPQFDSGPTSGRSPTALSDRARSAAGPGVLDRRSHVPAWGQGSDSHGAETLDTDVPGVHARGVRTPDRGPSGARVRPRSDPGPRRARANPTAPTGLRLVRAEAVPGERELGVIEDLGARSWASVIPVRGRSLSLLGPGDQARQVAGWGTVLAGLARDGTSVSRLQWVERCAPADPSPLYLGAARAAGPEPTRTSYRALVEANAPGSLEHHALLVVAVRGRRSLAGRRLAPGSLSELLRRETRLVRGQLRGAELTADEPLDPGALAAVLRAAGAPTCPAMGSDGLDGGSGAVWPSVVDERWGSVRVDDSWQATYWLAEWPRLPVGADFLGPLLLGSVSRSVAVTMAPVPVERATREVQSARTAGLADDALRARAGFVPTARREREAEGVRRREIELAVGHADYRYSGYVTVAGRTPADLDAACAEVEQSARHSHLVLRRLYGRQAEARTWTLPIARGLT